MELDLLMSSQCKSLYFRLDLGHDECLLYYSGEVRQIIVSTEDNSTVQFPAQLIREFVRHDGVHGRFRIKFDQNNKLISLDCLGN